MPPQRRHAATDLPSALRLLPKERSCGSAQQATTARESERETWTWLACLTCVQVWAHDGRIPLHARALQRAARRGGAGGGHARAAAGAGCVGAGAQHARRAAPAPAAGAALQPAGCVRACMCVYGPHAHGTHGTHGTAAFTYALWTHSALDAVSIVHVHVHDASFVGLPVARLQSRVAHACVAVWLCVAAQRRRCWWSGWRGRPARAAPRASTCRCTSCSAAGRWRRWQHGRGEPRLRLRLPTSAPWLPCPARLTPRRLALPWHCEASGRCVCASG